MRINSKTLVFSKNDTEYTDIEKLAVHIANQARYDNVAALHLCRTAEDSNMLFKIAEISQEPIRSNNHVNAPTNNNIPANTQEQVDQQDINNFKNDSALQFVQENNLTNPEDINKFVDTFNNAQLDKNTFNSSVEQQQQQNPQDPNNMKVV